METITSISSITATGTYVIQGVVDAVTTKGFIVRDNTASILVYINSAPTVALGDLVKVSGTVSIYNGAFQFTNTPLPVVTVLTEGDKPTVPVAIALTPELVNGFAAKTSFATTDIVKYSWMSEATTISSKGKEYICLNLEGSDVLIEPNYSITALTPVDGKLYDVEAYVTGYNSSNSYVATALTKLVEHTDAVAPTSLTIAAAGQATSIGTNATLQLSVSAVVPTYASTAVTWASNYDKVTVDVNGLVTCAADAIDNQEVIITATSTVDTSISATYTLKVIAKLVTLTSSVADDTLGNNASESLAITGALSDGVTGTVTLSTEDTAIITLDATTGIVTPVKAGTATVKGTADGYTEASIAITVLPSVAEVNAMASGSSFTTRAKVLATSGNGVSGYVVGDATGTFGYVYAAPTADVVVGNYIEMTGITNLYSNSILELVPATVTKLETAGPTLANTATAWTHTEYDAYDGKSVQYVSLTGAEVASSGNHHNFTIDGSSNKGGINNVIADGFYDFTGFAYGISGGYRSFVLDSWTEAVRPAATALSISAAGNATTLAKGNTLQLSAAVTAPFGAALPAELTWSSSDAADDSIVAADKVTVDSTGLVTAPATATAHNVIITVASATAQEVRGTYTIGILANAPVYTKLAAYDFGTGNTSTATLVDDSLKTLFASKASSTSGISDIVSGISGTTSVSAGYVGYGAFGLKFGTSSKNGAFTATTSTAVSRVVVTTISWTVTDSLTIGTAATQTPGLAYASGTPAVPGTPVVETFDFADALTSIVFTYSKRGYISIIEFYSAA